MEKTDRDRKFEKFYEASRKDIISLAPRATRQNDSIASPQDHENASAPRSWLAALGARPLRVLG
jgi:hypothetical protein